MSLNLANKIDSIRNLRSNPVRELNFKIQSAKTNLVYLNSLLADERRTKSIEFNKKIIEDAEKEIEKLLK